MLVTVLDDDDVAASRADESQQTGDRVPATETDTQSLTVSLLSGVAEAVGYARKLVGYGRGLDRRVSRARLPCSTASVLKSKRATVVLLLAYWTSLRSTRAQDTC